MLQPGLLVLKMRGRCSDHCHGDEQTEELDKGKSRSLLGVPVYNCQGILHDINGPAVQNTLLTFPTAGLDPAPQIRKVPRGSEMLLISDKLAVSGPGE